MNWKEVRSNLWRSDCGRYEVDGLVVCNVHGPVRVYEARRTRAHGDGPHLVAANIPTAVEAKKLAEADSLE